MLQFAHFAVDERRKISSLRRSAVGFSSLRTPLKSSLHFLLSLLMLTTARLRGVKSRAASWTCTPLRAAAASGAAVTSSGSAAAEAPPRLGLLGACSMPPGSKLAPNVAIWGLLGIGRGNLEFDVG